MTESMKVTASWDVAPCSLVEVDVSEVHTASIIRVMMEAVHIFEMSIYFHETA
jgi:hypothetical protein